MDLLQGVRDAQAEDPIVGDEDFQSVPHPAGDFQMPTPEKLLEMLDKLNMSEEEKDEIRDSLIKNVAQRVRGQDFFMQWRILIVLCCVLLLLLIFVLDHCAPLRHAPEPMKWKRTTTCLFDYLFSCYFIFV